MVQKWPQERKQIQDGRWAGVRQGPELAGRREDAAELSAEVSGPLCTKNALWVGPLPSDLS